MLNHDCEPDDTGERVGAACHRANSAESPAINARWLVESGAQTRILMLTAATAVRERVAGLGLGADDYLTKPFAFAELAARIQALGRRARPAAPPVLERAGIRLDPHRRTVTRDGEHVSLSRKEFAVLAELLRAEGGVVSAEQLLEKVGLGLSIVRSVAHAHGGAVHAAARPEGGLTIHVRLPALATDEGITSPHHTPHPP